MRLFRQRTVSGTTRSQNSAASSGDGLDIINLLYEQQATCRSVANSLVIHCCYHVATNKQQIRTMMASSSSSSVATRSVFLGVLLIMLLCGDLGGRAAVEALSPSLTRSNALTRTWMSSNTNTNIHTRLEMARPGQSEAQARQEREEEIRSQLAKLKGAGKLKNGKGSESMMNDAEAFFNQESPSQKFQRRQRERQEREERQQQQQQGDGNDTVNNSEIP